MDDEPEHEDWKEWGPWQVVVSAHGWSERQRRANVLRDQPTTPELVAYIDEALTIEPDDDAAAALLMARSWHAGERRGVAFEIFWQAYKNAAQYRSARNALHKALDKLKGGFERTHISKVLFDSVDVEEHTLLLRLLPELAPSEDRLGICNRLLERKPLLAENDLIAAWKRALDDEKKRSPLRAERSQDDARLRLLSVLPTLGNQSHVDALKMLSGDLYGGECADVLVASTRHLSSAVRQVAIAWLPRLRDRGTRIAWELLTAETDHDRLWQIADLLQGAGADKVAVLRVMANNPDRRAVAEVIFRNLRWDGQRHEWISLVRRIWPGLPADCRDAIEEYARTDFDHHHHPRDMEFWWEIRHAFRKALAPATQVLLASFVTRPFHELVGVYDFEAITGLRRRHPVTFRSSPVLRFVFLEQTKTREGRPVVDVLQTGRELGFTRLVAMEREFDGVRDELAQVTGEIASLVAELGDEAIAEIRRRAAQERGIEEETARRTFGEAGARFEKLEWRYRTLSKQVDVNSENSPFFELGRASRHYLSTLKEIGCSFSGMPAPDGILGEYQPSDRSITLFDPMIELAAADVQARLGRGATNVLALVRTIVEVHELAHAHIHLGEDASGRIWNEPGQASRAYHEALAQLYTRRLLDKLAEPGLIPVLREMEKWLRGGYEHADFLEKLDPEEVRYYLIRRRNQIPRRTLAEVLDTICQALPGYLLLLQPLLPREVWARLHQSINESLGALDDALADPKAFPSALDTFIAQVGRLPQATGALGAFLSGGWPDAEELRWLVFHAMVAGDPVGDGALRFLRPEDIAAAVTSSPNSALLRLRPTLRVSRERLDKLRELAAGRAPTRAVNSKSRRNRGRS